MNTIVLIDDDLDSLELVRDVLSPGNKYEFQTFLDPAKALEYIRNNSSTINLVITDIMMPGLSGIDLIKKCGSLQNIPVLFLTCLDDNETIKEAFTFKDKVLTINYITKPFNPTMLISSVETLLQTKEYFSDVLLKNINIENLLKETGSENVYLFNRLTRILKLDQEKAEKLDEVRKLISGIFKNDLPLVKFISRVIEENVENLDKIISEGDEYFRVLPHMSEPLKTVVSDIRMVVDLLINLGIINKSDMEVENIEKTTFYNILLRLYSMGEFSTESFINYLEIAEFNKQANSGEEESDAILF